MWIKQAAYIALVEKAARVETRADWLMQRVNQLERELAGVRFEKTGVPQTVPFYAKTEASAPTPVDETETEFEDMGDERARVHGVSWDDQGRVRFTV